MATISVQACVNANSLITNTCDSADLVWTEISYVDLVTLNDLLFNVDPETVAAIFGAGLLLFVTGIGVGWVVSIIKMARA